MYVYVLVVRHLNFKYCICDLLDRIESRLTFGSDEQENENDGCFEVSESGAFDLNKMQAGGLMHQIPNRDARFTGLGQVNWRQQYVLITIGELDLQVAKCTSYKGENFYFYLL